MNSLITVAEFASYRNISAKQNTPMIEEAISLAQRSDLVDVLGDFVFDVLKNKDEPAWEELLEGVVFTYNGDEFEHDGIKRMLADYTHARYVYLKQNNDTPFGFLTKDTKDGTPVDRNVLKDLAKQDQIDAGIKFRYIEKYILSKPTLFARYCKNKEQGGSYKQMRITNLKK